MGRTRANRLKREARKIGHKKGHSLGNFFRNRPDSPLYIAHCHVCNKKAVVDETLYRGMKGIEIYGPAIFDYCSTRKEIEMGQTEQQARVIGAKVCGILGKGWKVNVWENLGWHVSWYNGAVSLHYSPQMDEKFWAMVGPIGSGAGSVELTPRTGKHFAGPIRAIRAAIEFAQEQNKEREQIMKSCSTVLMDLMKTLLKE